MIEYAAVIIGSYIIGSIPWGLIIGKLKGIDVRRYGSGNIGTTNVLRTIGTRWAAVVLALDVLKGVIAVIIGHYVIGSPAGEIAAGFAAVAGHDWSIFLRFRGGRGVATTLGCVLAMEPLAPVVGIAIFVILIALTRYVSLGSICGSLSAVAAMGAFWAVDRVPWQYFLFIAVAVALIIFQHRDNIARLRAGTESKLGQKGEKRQS